MKKRTKTDIIKNGSFSSVILNGISAVTKISAEEFFLLPILFL